MLPLCANFDTGLSYPSQKPPTEVEDGTDLNGFLGTSGETRDWWRDFFA